MEKTARLQSSSVSNQTPYKKQSSCFENMSLIVHIVFYPCLVFLFLIFINCVGNLTRKLSSASRLGNMEESYFLQASLYPSEILSERRNLGETIVSPYYMKSMTPNAFEAAIHEEGELASYLSRLVCVFLNSF